jgi:signal transduction histidine kinase
MENGGVVTLACHESQEGLVIEVSDNGPGISKEIKPKLFSPFFTTKENGTGLGLSSVHKIIAAHGGHIEVVTDSQKNELVDGAKFIISIPSNLNW